MNLDALEIADALRAARGTTGTSERATNRNDGLLCAAAYLATRFAAKYPRFDRAEFMRACGVES